MERNDDVRCARLSLGGLHDALLSVVTVDHTAEIAVRFDRGSAEYLVVGGMTAERVYVQASGVLAVSVMVGAPLTGSTTEMIKSVNFMEWCRTLADDAVDVLSAVVSMPSARHAPCILEVTGATNERVQLIVWCTSLTFRCDRHDGDVVLALPTQDTG